MFVDFLENFRDFLNEWMNLYVFLYICPSRFGESVTPAMRAKAEVFIYFHKKIILSPYTLVLEGNLQNITFCVNFKPYCMYPSFPCVSVFRIHFIFMWIRIRPKIKKKSNFFLLNLFLLKDELLKTIFFFVIYYFYFSCV